MHKAKPEADAQPHATDHESIANSMSKYLQTHLPKMPHRPTKEELLAAANGFWERLKVRFKWFLDPEYETMERRRVGSFRFVVPLRTPGLDPGRNDDLLLSNHLHGQYRVCPG